MKIDFRPASKFAKVLVGETVAPNKKSVDRFFAYEKVSRNPYNDKIMVMRQTINETKRGWLVTDMEVFDSKSGRVVKSLKRNVEQDGSFETKLTFIDKSGNKQNRTFEHPAK